MSDVTQVELRALCERWRKRAKRFMAEAERTHLSADVVRFTAMASTLNFAADDLSVYLMPPQIGRGN